MATVVAFHAHPDDEAIWTGGTLARLAAEGHRVVIVLACDGAVWPHHGTVRLERFRTSAAILGAARAEHLGYADSGRGPVLFQDPPGRVRFARADLGEAAGRLADIIRSENADLLLSYDAAGGNKHRDHVRVHEVAARAAELTGVRVLEATGPREVAIWVYRLAGAIRLMARYPMPEIRGYGTPRALITHRVNVRPYAVVKQRALAAHLTAGRGQTRMSRVWRVAVALPPPAYRFFFGREWFTEPGATPGGPVRDHVLPA